MKGDPITYLRRGRVVRGSGKIIDTNERGFLKVDPARVGWKAIWVSPDEHAAGSEKPPIRAKQPGPALSAPATLDPDFRKLKEEEKARYDAGRNLQLYVWLQFAPDHNDGLAFAIAHDEEEAQLLISNEMGYSPMEWGPVSIHPITHPIGFGTSGGG